MFRRRTEPVPLDLTNDAYRRWLRAQRPPSDLLGRSFLALSELEQEALANLGDEYVDGVAESIAGEPENEEDAARRIVTEALGKRMGVEPKAPARAPREPLSMGGITKRREAKESERAHAAASGKSLMGRAPDAAREKCGTDAGEVRDCPDDSNGGPG